MIQGFNFNEINYFMARARESAAEASFQGEVPVGAIIVGKNKEILATGLNTREEKNNPIGHAEINAICKASDFLGSWRLNECTLFVTLEPCLMCLGAIYQARLKGVFFGAYDRKGGAISRNYPFYKDKELNHRFFMCGGINSYENGKLLSDFFRKKRKNYQKQSL